MGQYCLLCTVYAGLELIIGLLVSLSVKQKLDGFVALFKLANKATSLSPMYELLHLQHHNRWAFVLCLIMFVVIKIGCVTMITICLRRWEKITICWNHTYVHLYRNRRGRITRTRNMHMILGPTSCFHTTIEEIGMF